MYAGRDFSSVDGAVETPRCGFDFTATRADSTDYIVSVVWSLAVITGTDPSPSSRLVTPLQSGQLCSVALQGLVVDTKYRLMAVATFNSGIVLDLWAYVSSVPVPPAT